MRGIQRQREREWRQRKRERERERERERDLRSVPHTEYAFALNLGMEPWLLDLSLSALNTCCPEIVKLTYS